MWNLVVSSGVDTTRLGNVNSGQLHHSTILTGSQRIYDKPVDCLPSRPSNRLEVFHHAAAYQYMLPCGSITCDTEEAVIEELGESLP